MEKFFAHSLPERPISDWQPLKEHLRNVADLATAFAECFNARDWAFLTGLWHDLGKFSKEYQERVLNVDDPEANIETRHRRVDHSTAGARYAVNVFDRKKGLIHALCHSRTPFRIDSGDFK